MEQQDYFLVDLQVTHRFSCCSTERMCLLVVRLVPLEGANKPTERSPKDVKKAPTLRRGLLVCLLAVEVDGAYTPEPTGSFFLCYDVTKLEAGCRGQT